MKSPSEFIKDRKSDIDTLVASEIEIKNVSQIPDNENIPLEGTKWLKAETISCVYIDLVKSTELQVIKEPKTTAKIYELFVGNMVRTFDNYEAEFIDVRGDGGFGVFVGENSSVIGLCAAVTFKTLCSKQLENIYPNFKIRPHIGIDQKTVLFKQVGMRGDRKNVVWAGKPVNMAAKLASMGGAQETVVSQRVYEILSKPSFQSYAIMSCGCGGSQRGVPSALWTEKNVSTLPHFDFEKAYVNSSLWCDSHGDGYCEKLLAATNKKSMDSKVLADRLRAFYKL